MTHRDPLDRAVRWALVTIAGLAILTACASRARGGGLPPTWATILVRVSPEGRIIDRRAGSDRFSSLRHLGWVRALRPPGVCIRTALQDRVPAWLDWGEQPWLARSMYPHVLPVAWDARGLGRYWEQSGPHGYATLPVPPSWAAEAARDWAKPTLALLADHMGRWPPWADGRGPLWKPAGW